MDGNTRTRSGDAQPLDSIFGLLRDSRRRHAVAVLSKRDSPVDLRELAAAVAAREAGIDPDAVSDETTDEVVATLHHVHLPKLADAGVLAYDAAANTVWPIRLAELSSPVTGAVDDC